MSESRFESRTVIVTGAGSGIGHATALRLAAEGARVIAVDLARDRLRQLESELGDRVIAIDGDLVDQLTIDRVPIMLARGKGSIVNVGSEAGLRGSAAGTPYTVSKHAVNGLTSSTAFYYTRKGVRCNAVAPGPVATNIEAPFRSQWAQERLGPIMQTVLPAIAQPEALAAAITWLLSDEASDVSGAILPVDGGWAAI